MGVREEISKIPKLKNIGLAIIDYVEDLDPDITFELKSKRWVPSKNFITFTIQHAQKQNIAISLRGNLKEFLRFDELPLRKGMGNGAYSECTLNHVNQLPALAMTIRRAYELYHQGRQREKRHPSIIYVSV
ncbi:MAG: hypothetical protein PHN45_03450 [Methylococcales bacterium]|nr:hypothetical protein [Methylococcales bacterium]MDD5753789.1 hypothetical protein [Methylococcales bacterium]